MRPARSRDHPGVRALTRAAPICHGKATDQAKLLYSVFRGVVNKQAASGRAASGSTISDDWQTAV
jgi:hypothetical protein